MRFLPPLLLFICVAAASQGQISLWERQYGRPDRAEFATGRVVETPSGDYVLCGFTMGATPWDIDGLIIKLSASGDTLWTRQVGSTGLGGAGDFLWGIALGPNDELLLTGTRYHAPFGRQLWFLKYDQDGNCLIDKRYGGNKEDNGNEILVNSDGSYMILGDTESSGTQNGGKDVWLLKLDAQGDTLWTRTYDFGFEDAGTGIIPFRSGGYLLTATSCVANCGKLLQESFCSYFLIDAAGNLLKRRVFDQGKRNIFSQEAATQDGGAILCGATCMSDTFPAPDVWLVKLDQEGEISWSKTIGYPHRYDGGLSIFQSRDGGYYLAAYSQGVQTPQMNYDNWWLLRLTSTGDTLWTKWWGWPLNDDPYSIIPTCDGGILIAGWKDANSDPFYSISLGNADLYVAKVDTLGRSTAVGLAASLAPSECLLGHIYPNPFNATATMHMLLAHVGHVTLEVFDARGRKVATLLSGVYEPGDHVVQWAAAGLPSGLYFCRLTSDRNVSWTKALLVR
ncbi:MAG: T9SS type A sorting domain-containing protein [Calditrichaeota bacterium]|nr:T9SS type A sorting domain-containing protein [Calditrichota bacterium]